ncbi:TIP41-like protein [Tribolium castaneum]|uniref:TIP41-like protein n=1 Tax=Tribolium castaneum TaxID=7070 RepID=D1ZZJ5_TRICA|nr:PREDICTED: TIP41-like protein [Tribolium castaneum]XP_015835049.1 PREDICTED: TIP41-like protein [Tribolium castaneum]EFA01841.1 TIP41-like protein [Tribolium castaneum]|eukprot:XP_008192092.1 PREDICTED: TIP41-like protein [Tribolium castaneum]
MSAVTPNKNEIDIQRLPVNSEEHIFHDWVIKYKKSHILHSICTSAEKCKDLSQEPCLLCLYTRTLDIPHLPEMVFPNNVLTLTHSSGGQIEFNALDALKTVANGKLPIKVACSEEWSESRPPEHLSQKIKPFDWTFSNDYKGTITGPVQVVPTEERINIEKLKEKEKILFYQELMLYEDELHDNGISSCTIKIRVMPSSYFILLRFFLRVDNVMLRVNDTRLYHEFSTNYILREFTNKECAFGDVELPLNVFGNPNVLSPHMPVRTAVNEKLIFGECKPPTEGAADQCSMQSTSKND